MEVVGREERVARLGKVLGGGADVPLGARVNTGAVAEATALASGVEARTVLGTAEGVMDGLVVLVEEKANARAVRVWIRALFALCLAKENRPCAMAAGATSALARRMVEGDTGEPERTLVTMERLCRAEGGRDIVVAGAEGRAAAVVALVCAMSGHAAEHMAGALVAVVGGCEALQVEAVRAGAMSQLLMLVQGGCLERSKRKAQHLLKLVHAMSGSTDCFGVGMRSTPMDRCAMHHS